MLVAYITPATKTALTGHLPQGFLLLWARCSANLIFVFLLLAFSAKSLTAAVNKTQTRVFVIKRGQLGMRFATSHAYHLVALILFLANEERYRSVRGLQLLA